MDSSQTGINDSSSCWEGGYSTPCLSLNMALKGAQECNHSITILLQPGQHQLHNGRETELKDMSQLAIVGNSSEGEPVVITCQPLTGLAFLRSTNITISNFSLINCGRIRSEHNNDYNPIRVAILFTGCSSIELSNLHINESSGTGVAVYNAMDQVSIDSCQFMYGGEGLVIEASEATSQSFCTITNSTFTHNTASSAAAGQWINPCGSTTRGGGISVVFRGEATNNTVQLVNNVRLNNNKAQFGGGLYLGFHDNASGNTVTVDNVEVTENEVIIERDSPAYVRYDYYNYRIESGGTLNHTRAVHDIWGRNIKDPDKILIEFINGPAFTLDQLSTLSSQILANCSDNYTNQSSLLYIHPLQFSAIRVTIHFRQCSLSTSSPPTISSPSSCNTCRTSGKNGGCPSSYSTNDRSRSCVQGRGGILCGNCSEGYAVAINDPDLSCIECDSPYNGVAIFLFLQLVPVLIMLTLLAVLHIKITDGSFSGFVLISQMVTLQFPGLGYSSWIPVCYGSESDMFMRKNHLSIPLTVYSIWNLNFLNLDPVPFCIPHINTAAGAILLEYITAVCPLMFIVVTYAWIKCYNNGYRLVVYTTRPVHQLLARFWQKFKIQPSLIDTYAGLMLLSYMRFLTTSAKLLKFTFVLANTDEDYNYTLAFYYDANLSYFTSHHAAYGVLAILCLLVFVLTPTIILLFYHLKCFQRCLTRCKLDRPGLHALVDAYQGCFKNSATDGSERRYFAGLYLLFRFCYVFFLITPVFLFPISVAIFEMCFSFIMAAVIAIFRPYKTIVHNFTNFMSVFFLLVYVSAGFITVLGLYSVVFYIMLLFFLYIPLLVLCIYLTYCLFKPCYARITICKCRKKQNPANDEPPPEYQAPTIEASFTTVSLHDYIADDLYADRLLNPDEYKKQ